MPPRRAFLIVVMSTALTWCVAAFLMNIAERKQEGKLLDQCLCPSESCPHPSRVVK